MVGAGRGVKYGDLTTKIGIKNLTVFCHHGKKRKTY